MSCRAGHPFVVENHLFSPLILDPEEHAHTWIVMAPQPSTAVVAKAQIPTPSLLDKSQVRAKKQCFEDADEITGSQSFPGATQTHPR